ncbi:Lysine-specific demethylase 8 [Rhizoctonia solani AG-1 IB]|uniref:Lysine-specific demethylase 8 n=1 Tax=Thanatephorus cucumeris (strain AG1-IB / isolate 7/3/14) TaxID=1108050 RepID=M5C0X9_THACB|nr:Lysine-specific demethylase 8 [Rhizoctonia solani AG-1 IB]
MSSGSDYDSDTSFDQPGNISNFLEDREWPNTTLVATLEELKDVSHPNTQDIIGCGKDLTESLKVFSLDPEIVQPKLALGHEWRRLYTDCVLLQCLKWLKEKSKNGSSESDGSTKEWEQAIRLLDQVIILAGAPGEGRLELVISCISYIQHWYLPLGIELFELPQKSSQPPTLSLATNSVVMIAPPPSLSAFPALSQRPFVLPEFASSWPATTKWKSKSYLVSCAGRGRVVPVERGGDYRTDDWAVELMPWSEFLDKISWGEERDDDNKLYLAQHSLLTQLPKLRADIEVPDYAYAEPQSHRCYIGPPGNAEQLVINAWCGGKGANSPAHTDPYYNIYVQIVGYKTIWLAPPEASLGMYAFNTASEPSHRDDDSTEPSRDPKREGMMGNTSSIDVFALSAPDASEPSFPLFFSHSLPMAQSVMLKPGDALVIPPGWWHAMRGVGRGSFSVSFWF